MSCEEPMAGRKNAKMDITISPLSLLELSKTKICTSLWTSAEVIKKIDHIVETISSADVTEATKCCGCDSERKRELFLAKYHVEKNLDKLPLSKTCKKNLLSTLEEIGLSFVTWLWDSVDDKYYWMVSATRRLYLKNLKWSYGFVDTLQSEISLLADDDLNEFNRFVLACRLGKEDEIASLWKLPTVHTYADSNAVPSEDSHCVKVWSMYAGFMQCKLKSDEVVTAVSFRQFVYGEAFRKALLVGDNASLEYWWKNLSLSEQGKHLELLIDRRTTIKVKSFWSYVFCAAKMNDLQRRRFTRRFFSTWSRQINKNGELYLFELAGPYLISFITYKTFLDSLLHYVKHTIDCPQLESLTNNLLTLWKAAPVQYRKRFVERHMGTPLICCGEVYTLMHAMNLHQAKLETIAGDIIGYMTCNPNFVIVSQTSVEIDDENGVDFD